jgi:hypothetical protein
VRLESAIASMHSKPKAWVVVDGARRVAGGLEIEFSVLAGRNGRPTSKFALACKGVLEASFSDLGLGGLRLYSPDHPAARQYAARKATLRWSPGEQPIDVLGALVRAHTTAVDDWIPVERYLSDQFSERRQPMCQGPEFLLKVYAQTLRALGLRCRVTVRPRPVAARKRPRVLHFGASFVVAREFRIRSQ